MSINIRNVAINVEPVQENLDGTYSGGFISVSAFGQGLDNPNSDFVQHENVSCNENPKECAGTTNPGTSGKRECINTGCTGSDNGTCTNTACIPGSRGGAVGLDGGSSVS